jgi:hypothetical protein
MIPTFQLGQTGQASNRGRVAWRAINPSNTVWAHATDYVLNLTQNVKDDLNNQPNPDSDRITLPYAGWYAFSGGYRTNNWPSTGGYNSCLISSSPSASQTIIAWHENHMYSGYPAGKMLFGVGYVPGGSTASVSGNQYSSNNVTLTGNTIHMASLSLHNNMQPYGVDVVGAGTSLLTATPTPLTYTTGYRDDGGFWSGTATTNFVVPSGAAGWYVMSGWYRLLDPPSGFGGARSYWVINSDPNMLGGSSTPCDNGSKSPPAVAVYYLNDGDSLQFFADQNVGSTRTTERQRVALTRVATTNGVSVSRTTSQSVVMLTTDAISFDTEVRDDLGAWTISDPTKLTVPSGGTGWYIICGTLWCSALSSGDREVILVANGTTDLAWMQQWTPSYHNDPRLCVGTIYYLTEGEYIEMRLRNGSPGSSVSTQGYTRLSMVKID